MSPSNVVKRTKPLVVRILETGLAKRLIYLKPIDPARRDAALRAQDPFRFTGPGQVLALWWTRDVLFWPLRFEYICVNL